MLARWWRVVWRVVVLETTWEMDGGEDGIDGDRAGKSVDKGMQPSVGVVGE